MPHPITSSKAHRSAGLSIASLLPFGSLRQVGSGQGVGITDGTMKPLHVFTWTVDLGPFSTHPSKDQVNRQIHFGAIHDPMWANSSTAIGVSL